MERVLVARALGPRRSTKTILFSMGSARCVAVSATESTATRQAVTRGTTSTSALLFMADGKKRVWPPSMRR